VSKNQETDPTEPDAPTIDFASFLETHADGETNRALSERFSSVIAATKDTRQKGEMTVKIQINPDGEYRAKVDIACSLKLPQPPLGGDLYHFFGATSLSKEDPRQLKINLRDLGGKSARADETREPGKKPE
jgi:hypothetical protein